MGAADVYVMEKTICVLNDPINDNKIWSCNEIYATNIENVERK